MKSSFPRPLGHRRSVIIALAVLALALPKLSMAQAVAPAPADLVGSWALRDSTEFGYTFGADSTLRYVAHTAQGKAVLTGRWRLAGDTLVVSGATVKLNGRATSFDFGQRVVAVQKTQLTVTRTDTKRSKVFERVDSLTGSAHGPAPAAPKP